MEDEKTNRRKLREYGIKMYEAVLRCQKKHSIRSKESAKIKDLLQLSQRWILTDRFDQSLA
jgi:hypothetical protein